MADSGQCMTKQCMKCCEVISLQLIKINEKKKKNGFVINQSLISSLTV